MKPGILRIGLLIGIILALMVGMAWAAEELVVEEFPITKTNAYETTPTLGNDGVSDYVVYASRVLEADDDLGPGDIYYQRLDPAGGPSGAPVLVSPGSTDDVLNDAFNNYIVYTAYESVDSFIGVPMLYDISIGGIPIPLGLPGLVSESRIHGSSVVWIEGSGSDRYVMRYKLEWLGTDTAAEVLAGPFPASDIDIGDYYVVWVETVGSQTDIMAYDLTNDRLVIVTASSEIRETSPTTNGSWITWQETDIHTGDSRIGAIDLWTAQYRTVCDNGAVNLRPSLDGDLITWESMLFGNLDVFVYRISTEKTFAVTTDTGHQYLNNIFGNLVTYVDTRFGTEDIFVATLSFATPDPCAGSGGDSDGDTICDDNDNCPLDANTDQADTDYDGVGDACEVDADGDTWDTIQDCDDSNPDINPDASELCNGIDDDCDGWVDETFTNLGSSCMGGVGECTSTGIMICKTDGTGTECDAVPGTPGVEICDGLDNNCDGTVDNDLTPPLNTLQSGVCEGSLQLCTGTGGWINDYSGITTYEETEATCDYLDNDCDGLVDESFPDIGTPCTEGIGQCADVGVMVCIVDGTATECDAVPGEPTGEICDGLDNDCNGAVDDSDYDADGVLVCDDVCPDEDATGLDADSNGCIDSFAGLIDLLATLVNEGVISPELQNSLVSKVENAWAKTDKEKICTAVNQLDAFINEVNAQRGNKISDEGADLAVAYATNIQTHLLSQLQPGDTCN